MIPLVCLRGWFVHWMNILFLLHRQSVLSKRSLLALWSLLCASMDFSYTGWRACSSPTDNQCCPSEAYFHLMCFFLFFCFSVRKFVILLVLHGVFFSPPNFVLSKVWRFLFLLAIFLILVILFILFFLKFWFMIPITLTSKCNLLLCITAMYQAYVAIHIPKP